MYVRRFIDITFFGGKYGTITFNARGKFALRTAVRILRAGGYNLSEAQVQIRGLSLQHINQLSTYGTVVHPNYGYKIQIDAGDEINGMSTVFVGNIQQAWADMKAMPDCPFHVLATAGGEAAVKRVEPTSFEGPTDAETMLKQLAGKAGLGFKNFGLNKKIADPYFWGSPWKQMKEIVDACYGDCIIEQEQLKVWPKNGSGGNGLEISPGNGLRDYPSFTQFGVQVRYEFHREIDYRSVMTIRGSDIALANGPWTIIRIDYDLQSNTPRGNWFAIIDGMSLGAPVIPQL